MQRVDSWGRWESLLKEDRKAQLGAEQGDDCGREGSPLNEESRRNARKEMIKTLLQAAALYIR
jgi:hypothetical protein